MKQFFTLLFFFTQLTAFCQFQSNTRLIGGNFSINFQAEPDQIDGLSTEQLSIAVHPQFGWFLSEKWAFAIEAGVSWNRSNTLVYSNLYSFDANSIPVVVGQINNGNFNVGVTRNYFVSTQNEVDIKLMPSVRHYKMFGERIGIISEIGLPVVYYITTYPNENDPEVLSLGTSNSRGISYDNYYQLSLALTYTPRLLFMLNKKWGLEAAFGSFQAQYRMEKRGERKFTREKFSISASLTRAFSIGARYYFIPKLKEEK